MELYSHIRVVFGMILSLGIAHLLKGAALIIQHPKRFRVYWVHLVWTLFLFLYLVHFWWWEINLQRVQVWTFPLYLFVAFYAILLYFLCTLFFPDQIGDYDGFKGYFYSRRRWIFGFMAGLFVVDLFDTIIKGHDYYYRHQLAYNTRAAAYVLLCLVALKVRRPWFHAAFAVFALVYEVAFILEMYRTIG
jgi:hypothetical protein